MISTAASSVRRQFSVAHIHCWVASRESISAVDKFYIWLRTDLSDAIKFWTGNWYSKSAQNSLLRLLAVEVGLRVIFTISKPSVPWGWSPGGGAIGGLRGDLALPVFIPHTFV
jgi:hypothetical protein